MSGEAERHSDLRGLIEGHCSIGENTTKKYYWSCVGESDGSKCRLDAEGGIEMGEAWGVN